MQSGRFSLGEFKIGGRECAEKGVRVAVASGFWVPSWEADCPDEESF